MSKEIKPVNGHVVLQVIEEQEQMAGNIILPDLGKERPEMARVVETSPTFNYHSSNWKQSEVVVGDVVIIPRMGAQKITLDGEEFIICKDTDIIGIIK